MSPMEVWRIFFFSHPIEINFDSLRSFGENQKSHWRIKSWHRSCWCPYCCAWTHINAIESSGKRGSQRRESGQPSQWTRLWLVDFSSFDCNRCFVFSCTAMKIHFSPPQRENNQHDIRSKCCWKLSSLSLRGEKKNLSYFSIKSLHHFRCPTSRFSFPMWWWVYKMLDYFVGLQDCRWRRKCYWFEIYFSLSQFFG